LRLENVQRNRSPGGVRLVWFKFTETFRISHSRQGGGRERKSNFLDDRSIHCEREKRSEVIVILRV